MNVLNVLTDNSSKLTWLSEVMREMEIHVNFFEKPEFDPQNNKWLLFKYSRLLSLDELNLLGGLGNISNFHNAILPEYKGLNCPSWAIENGDSTLGVTLHLVDEKIDNGFIIDQIKFDFQENQDINDFQAIVRQLEITWLPRIILSWLRNECHLKNNFGGRVYRKRGDDNFISSTMSSKKIVDLIRAVNPPYGPGVRINDGNHGGMRFGIGISTESKNFLTYSREINLDFRTLDGSLKLTGFQSNVYS